MHLELVRDKAMVFPKVAAPASVLTARVWHCSYRTLAPLASLINLTVLEVATYPDDSLEHLQPLTKLEALRILHMPKVTDLQPLCALTALKRLSLCTLPSWDASGKVTEIASLAPVAALPGVEELELFGVVPPDRKVDELLTIGSLRQARLSQYPKSEIAKLRQAGVGDAFVRRLFPNTET